MGDNKGWTFWKVGYENPRPGECVDTLKTMNLLGMFTQKVASFGKYCFGTMGVYGKQGKCYVRGVWLIRGESCNPPELEAISSWEFYTKTKLDPVKDRARIMEFWTNTTCLQEPEVASEPDSDDEPDSSDSSDA